MMNISQHLYISGATMTVTHITQRKTGRRVAVLDPHRRKRGAIVAMLLDGMRPRQIALALDLPLPTVCKLGISGLSKRHKVGINP